MSQWGTLLFNSIYILFNIYLFIYLNFMHLLLFIVSLTKCNTIQQCDYSIMIVDCIYANLYVWEFLFFVWSMKFIIEMKWKKLSFSNLVFFIFFFYLRIVYSNCLKQLYATLKSKICFVFKWMERLFNNFLFFFFSCRSYEVCVGGHIFVAGRCDFIFFNRGECIFFCF